MLKLASLLITFLLMTVVPILADIRGTDATGRAVILRSDGTWNYVTGGGTGSGNLNMAVGKLCAANREFVISIFLSVLSRQPDASGLNYWTGRLNSGKTKMWLIAQIFKSREYTGSGKSNREFVRDAYQAILGRQPEPAGHSSWIKQLNKNMSRNAMIGHFLKSTEYVRKMARCGTGTGGTGGTGTGGTGSGGVGTAFLGCYIDKPDRDIKGYTYNNGQMTNKACISTCRNKGYRIAATQYARHCFCGNSHGRYGKVATSQCSYPCSGNAKEKCGASWRNSVYKIGAGTVPPPPPPPPTAKCRNYTNQAIAQQRQNQRRSCGFAGARWHTNYNRHYNACIGSTPHWRGVETKARADAIARCVARPTGGKATYLGCFVDKPERDIKGYTFASGQMTNPLCINTCRTKGFSIAATQFSSQCFCGNSSGKYGRAPKANECKYPCKGNDKTNCGGYWRNSVYKIGAGSISPPPPPLNQRTFNNPKWKGHIVDNCVTWATTCGGGGANNYCRKKGYAKASKWTHSRPGKTWVIGSNKLCSGNFCVGYSSITCTR